MERRGRRNRPVQEYLSPDLWREILCQLPVKDLLRFKSVCKTWRSIIEDPQFISLHLTRCKNNVEGSHLLILEWRRSQNYPVIRHSDTFRKKTGVSDRLLFRPREFSYIVGFINGLFVVRNNLNDTLTVWNPSIRKHFGIPPFPGSSERGIRLGFGFGFDPSTNDYKVVSVCGRTRSNSVTTIVYLYTFQSGRWRVISSGTSADRFPYLPISNAFIKGIIYWATTDGLFSFDMGKETFSYCNVPNYGSIVDKSVETIPVIFRESLALLTNESVNGSYRYCLWVRDQYGNWIKLLTVNIEADWCVFMCVKMKGGLLFKTEKGVCSYNTNTHEMKVLARSYGKYYPSFEYVESLVWPMGI